MSTFTPKMLGFGESGAMSGLFHIGTVGNLLAAEVVFPAQAGMVEADDYPGEVSGIAVQTTFVPCQTIGNAASQKLWRATFDAAADYVRTPTGTKGAPVTAGVTYRAEVWVAAGDARTYTLKARWYDSAGVFLSESTIGAAIALENTVCKFITGTAIAPAAAAFAALELTATTAGNVEVRWGGWTLLEESRINAAGNYFIAKTIIIYGTGSVKFLPDPTKARDFAAAVSNNLGTIPLQAGNVSTTTQTGLNIPVPYGYPLLAFAGDGETAAVYGVEVLA